MRLQWMNPETAIAEREVPLVAIALLYKRLAGAADELGLLGQMISDPAILTLISDIKGKMQQTLDRFELQFPYQYNLVSQSLHEYLYMLEHQEKGNSTDPDSAA